MSELTNVWPIEREMDNLQPLRSKNVSFIVRVWREAEQSWHGEIEHVGSGTRQPFRDDFTLLKFIEGWRQSLPQE